MTDVTWRSYIAGQFEWPELTHVSFQDFASHVEALRMTSDNVERNGADVYLALACGKAHPRALEMLQRKYFPALDDYLARMGFEAVTRQDVFQQVVLHLCTGDSPRILTYAGRAALGSWLRVATFRCAVNMANVGGIPWTAEREVTLSQLVSPDIDPETQATIEKARPLFQSALQRVMTELKDRDKTLLRLCFLDGLSIDGIGTLYGVHRATAARWICEIRRRIFQGVESVLVGEFGLRASEFHSLAFLVRSEIQLSLDRVLGAA